MTRRPEAGGQADLFGAVPKPAAAKARAVRQHRADAPATPPPAPNGHDASGDGAASLATRLSPAELEELAAALSDDALARLVVAAMRQLRRRLARGGSRAGRPSPALDRAARQLAAELGADGDTYET